MAHRRVKIADISQNEPNSHLKAYLVYASLRDVDSGELLISATLEYIANAICERQYLLVA